MYFKARLLQLIHEQRQAALEVCRLVRVNHVVLGKPVQHGLDLRKENHRLCLIGERAQFAYSISGGFMVIAVAQTLCVVGADALERGFVVCHDLLKNGLQIYTSDGPTQMPGEKYLVLNLFGCQDVQKGASSS